jgi:hypothetical protein
VCVACEMGPCGFLLLLIKLFSLTLSSHFFFMYDVAYGLKERHKRLKEGED